ncbi:MAG: hypothetical protein LUI15_01550 [Firmicutes bacterium]|nr:hypothetical protein [Bacillota bacterium]
MRGTILPRETVRKYNSRAAYLFLLYLNLSPEAITIDALTEMADACNMTYERAYAELLAACLDIDASGGDKALFKNYIIPAVHMLDAEKFKSDPYFKNIKLPEIKRGRWELTKMKFAPCEAFVCDEFIKTENCELVPQIGFFTEEFEFPAIKEDGREWMTLMPNETTTTIPSVNRAFGNVLTYGLGLGYFAYMCSEKENVSSVTVVEISNDAASLFREFILPQFPHADKVKIIAADAFEFAGSGKTADYDFIFADIWHDVGDGMEMYKKFKSLEAKNPSAVYDYWLERSISYYLDKSLWQNLY